MNCTYLKLHFCVMLGKRSKRQKPIATKIRKRRTTYIVVFNGSYKQLFNFATHQNTTGYRP